VFLVLAHLTPYRCHVQLLKNEQTNDMHHLACNGFSPPAKAIIPKENKNRLVRLLHSHVCNSYNSKQTPNQFPNRPAIQTMNKPNHNEKSSPFGLPLSLILSNYSNKLPFKTTYITFLQSLPLFITAQPRYIQNIRATTGID